MDKQEFIKQAKENGCDGERCNGWDWIKENLSPLDYIFQTEEYKACDGMASNCMLLLKGDDDLSDKDIKILHVAWYCNNERVHEQKVEAEIKKLNEQGFYQIEDDEKLNGKKIEFIVDNRGEMFGGMTNRKGKLQWSTVDKRLMAMESRHTRTGIWATSTSPKVYIKILNN